MGLDLSGDWKLSGQYRNSVRFELVDDVWLIKVKSDNGDGYRNIGIADKDISQLSPGDTFDVMWTDTADSNGCQKGVLHKTQIKVVSDRKMIEVSSVSYSQKGKNFTISTDSTTYGNFERK